jgi:autotransporter-associated beta strand protein
MPGWDKLAINGNLTLSGTPGDPYTLKLTTLDPATHAAGLAANFNNSQNYSWTIASLSGGTISGFNASAFAFDTGAFLNPLGAATFNVSATSTTLVLNMVGVPSTWNWTGAAGTDWHNGGNWLAGSPPGGTHTAIFNAAAANQPALTVAESALGLDFQTAAWTIGGAGQVLTVGSGGISSVGTNGNATNAINADLTAGAAQSWTVGSGNTLSLGGTWNAGGSTVTKEGAGTLTVSGPQAHASAAGLIVNAGTLNLNTDAGSSSSYNLSLTAHDSSIVNFGATQHLNSLTLTETALATVTSGTSKTIVTKSLSMPGSPSPTAKLDLTNNFLIVDYDAGTPLAAIQGYVKAGMGPKDGIGRVHWDGTSGITSSTANANYLTSAVGVMDNTFDFEGTRPVKTTFGGQAVDTSSILVRYTWWGDMNLDGVVDYNDVSILVYYYYHTPGGDKMGWQTGDLNYDGVMNYDDVSLMVYGYYHQGAPLGDAAMPVELQALVADGVGGSMGVTPEPATLAMFVAGVAALARRRRG